MSVTNFIARDAASASARAPARQQDHASDRATAGRRRGGEVAAVGVIALLVVLAWWISSLKLFEPGDDVGYWVGVAGGSMMLMLLAYPLRKRIKVLRRVGHVKAWLWGHMVLGIGGPLLVLVHCNFRAGSLNAAVALYSMVVVACSGIVGRFLYVRVNRGLAFERSQLDDERDRLLAQPLLATLPGVRDELTAFEQQLVQPSGGDGRTGWLASAVVLPARGWVAEWQLRRRVRRALIEHGRQEGWDAATITRRGSRLERAVVRWGSSVRRVARFAVRARLFALWHVAHVPLVFALVVAGIAHVVAVHAY